MADSPTDPEARDHTAGSSTGAPRWVKVFGIIAVVVVVLVVVLFVFGGGEHGPGRHAPGGGSDTTLETPGSHTGPPPGFEHGEERR